MRDLDPDLLKALTLRVWQYKQGEMVSLMIHLGERLGVYEALAGAGEVTSQQLADQLELDERWVREWLLGQAAAGLVTRTDDGSFLLGPEAEQVLVDPESLTYATAAFNGGEAPDAIEAIVEAFRTGRGRTYDGMGPELADQMDRQAGPWMRIFLLERVLPEVEGLIDRLESGMDVADVGCGGAVSTAALARRFPASTFLAVEPSRPAAAAAERRLADVANAEVLCAAGEQLPADRGFGLVLALDCMHDMPFPDRVAGAIAAGLADDGVWLIKDMRAAERFEDNLRNPMLALQYGYSVTSCLASATSEEGGLALGTMGFTPARAEVIARQAGFGSFRTIDLRDDPVHLYYEVRR